jgi:hypothetical protein
MAEYTSTVNAKPTISIGVFVYQLIDIKIGGILESNIAPPVIEF